MDRKKYIKKYFDNQIKEGYQFMYSNQDNTIYQYYLKNELICILFEEDYRHEFFDMKVIWNNTTVLIKAENGVCCSKIPCNNGIALEKTLNKIYPICKTGVRKVINDSQFCEMVQAYYSFLISNAFFENVNYVN